MASSPAPSAPPLIPGLLSTHHRDASRTHFRRGQLLARMAVGKPTSVEEEPPMPLSAPYRAPAAVGDASRGGDKRATAYLGSAFRADPTQPAWLTHDRQVLRFFGYFVERDAGEAVRRVVVCFYLSDRSIAISEPRVANSGRVQGAFLKRSVLCKPGPGGPQPFEPSDLRVGGELRVCGRVIHLVDCDAATRAFYQQSSGALEPAASSRTYPDDPRDANAAEVAAVRERLRARAKAQGESAAERARKFHELSGQVLRFSAVWKDPHPLYPETRRLALLFHLCDDTLEVLELQPRPSARGTASTASSSAALARSRVLLSRRRVVLERPGRAKEASASPRTVTARDLRCGEWLRVYARDVFLEDCDAFTRGYYLEALGVTQERFSIDDAPPTTARPPSPPNEPPVAAKWALFRSKPAPEADDRGHQPRHAGDALDGRQLRFRARFHGLRRDDPNAERQFVLTFFLEDDTLAVFEPRRAEATGGGRFLDRGRFRKAARAALGGTTTREQLKERSAYRAEDFFVGAVVCFDFSPSQRLELLEADAQTLAWCESHPEQFPWSDADAALERLAQAAAGRAAGDVVTALRRFDSDAARPGTVRVSDALCVLERVGLNAQQVLTLCRRFSDSDQGPVTTVFPPTATATPAITRARGSNGDGARQAEEPRVRYRALCDAVATHVAKAHAEASGNNAPATTNAPMEGLRGKLLRVPNLRAVLSVPTGGSSSRGGDGWVPMAQFFESTAAARVELDDRDVQKLVALGCVRNGRINAVRLWEFLQTDVDAGNDRRNAGGLHTGRTHEDPLAEDDWWSPRHSASVGDTGEPLANESATWAAPRLSPRLEREFGTRKYQLRRALRERDHDKSGRLAEDDFMDAVLSVEPALSDDDTYLIADAYFPTNNCSVDYVELLERAFRTA